MSVRPRVVIPGDDPGLVSKSARLEALSEFADVRLYLDRPTTNEEKVRRLQEANVLLNSRGSLQFPRAVLQQLPNLKMIAVCGIGYDSIDLSSATSQGILVCNVPGRTATVVAEHAIALMMAVSRQMAWLTAELRSGRWRGVLGISLQGKRLGVVGTGNIGCETIRLARALGMEVIAWTLNPDEEKAKRLGFNYESFDTLLSTSDVISLHTRLSDHTRGLIGRRELGLLKSSAILINTSRGVVVDSSALVEALQSGRIFGAGLDVFDQEPLPADHPLLQCENVVLTPHSADQTQEGLDLLTQGCIDNIRAWMTGCPTNVVNPDVLLNSKTAAGDCRFSSS